MQLVDARFCSSSARSMRSIFSSVITISDPRPRRSISAEPLVIGFLVVLEGVHEVVEGGRHRYHVADRAFGPAVIFKSFGFRQGPRRPRAGQVRIKLSFQAFEILRRSVLPVRKRAIAAGDQPARLASGQPRIPREPAFEFSGAGSARDPP